MKTFKELEELKKNEITDYEIRVESEVEIPSAEEDSREEEFDPDQEYRLNIETFDLVEFILKDQHRLHQFLMIPSLQTSLLPRFLTISLTGFLLFGLVLCLVFSSTGYWPMLESIPGWLEKPGMDLWVFKPIESSLGNLSPWLSRQVFVVLFSYAFGLIAATGVCLPSLYFYGLLAGVRMSMVEVVAHAMKGTAVTAVALIGILPIYVAVAMGAAIFSQSETFISNTFFIGMILPFIAGLWGTMSLYRAFKLLADQMDEKDKNKRACYLDRLVMSWSVCYSAVMPVMVYTIWQSLS